MREHSDGVSIGFDSQVSFGSHGADLEQPKVFANGDIILGVSGDVLAVNVLRHASLPPMPEDEWDVDRFVTNDLIPALGKALYDYNALKFNDGKAEAPFTALLVVRGRVYEVSTDLSWTRRVDRTYAVGSGWAFAIGAISAGASIREALDIAAQHDSGTGHRMTVVQSAQLLKEGIAA